MPTPGLTRRASLLLPLLLAACGGEEEPQIYPALRYAYLPPIRLNVATIEVQQRFIPSGVSPDVTQIAPVRPADALRAMAEDRLQAFGSSGRAVFSILDASLVRHRDVIDGAMAVRLDIYGPDNARVGFAEARVTRQHTGDPDPIRKTLYEMVKAMMDSMNVEFEYQVRRVLRSWVTTGTAAETPVEQTPLGAPGSTAAPTTPPAGVASPDTLAPPATQAVPPTYAPPTYAPRPTRRQATRRQAYAPPPNYAAPSYTPPTTLVPPGSSLAPRP